MTRPDRQRQEHENTVKVLFFILTRIGGEVKRISMNEEVIYVPGKDQ